MDTLQKATFGAGCFWHVQDAFDAIKGVKETTVGYMGGTIKEPTYEQVSSHTTGHVEVTEVTYDSNEVSYEELLKAFWAMHDPSQVDRQGPDVGSNYRSVIFYHTPEQKAAAAKSKDALEASGKADGQIATQIEPATEFWPAEEYHQKYFKKHGVSVCPV